MNRRSVLTSLLALAALAMTAGCSSPSDVTDEDDGDTETSAAALATCENQDGNPEECDGPARGAFLMTAFNPATGQLSGYNQLGATFTSIVKANTQFKKANLNRFIPGEPTRPLLVQYNNAVQSGQPYNQLAGLVTAGVTMRVRINPNGVVKALRPVPAR